MAVAFGTVTAAINATGTRPASLVDGELLVALIAVNESATATPPAGWASFSTDANANIRIHAHWKVAASEPATWAWTVSPGTASVEVHVYRFTGALTSGAPTAAYGTGSGTAQTAPSVTGVTGGELLCGFTEEGATTTWTSAAITERADNSDGWGSMMSGTADLASAAATGTKAATSTFSAAYRSISVVVSPAVTAVTAANSFDGGTTATTVTPANSGGVSGTAFNVVNSTGTTCQYDATRAAHGTLGLKIATTTAAAADVQWTTAIGTQSTVYGRFYLYATANPAATVRITTIATSGGTTLCSGIYLFTNGTLVMTNSATATTLQTTAGVNLNGWTRVEFRVDASATVGHIELRMYKAADSATATESLSSPSNLNTATNMALYSIGQGFDTKVNVGPIWFDDIGIQTAGYFGPAALTGPQPVTNINQVALNRAAYF